MNRNVVWFFALSCVFLKGCSGCVETRKKTPEEIKKEQEAEKEKLAAMTPAERAEYQAQKEENARAKKIKSMMSWDGSHKTLKSYVMKNMHDPSSFDHAETNTCELNENEILVHMTFRGKNAFGGLVLNQVFAISDLDGNIVVVEEDTFNRKLAQVILKNKKEFENPLYRNLESGKKYAIYEEIPLASKHPDDPKNTRKDDPFDMGLLPIGESAHTFEVIKSIPQSPNGNPWYFIDFNGGKAWINSEDLRGKIINK